MNRLCIGVNLTLTLSWQNLYVGIMIIKRNILEQMRIHIMQFTKRHATYITHTLSRRDGWYEHTHTASFNELYSFFNLVITSKTVRRALVEFMYFACHLTLARSRCECMLVVIYPHKHTHELGCVFSNDYF